METSHSQNKTGPSRAKRVNPTPRTLHPILSLSFVITCLLTVLAFGTAQAAPLNLVLQDSPDIFSNSILITYDDSSGVFTAVGDAIDLDGVFFDSFPGIFAITANITAATGVANSGLLTITGEIPGLGLTSPPPELLTGDLTAFGFPNGPDAAFEFIFAVTGGSGAASEGGPFGEKVGVILNLATDFTGNFTGYTGNGGNALADTATIPEPGTALLMLSGLAGLYVLRKRARVKNS